MRSECRVEPPSGSVNDAGCEQQISSGEVKREYVRGLRSVRAEQQIVRVRFDHRKLRDVHFLRVELFEQLVRVPQIDAVVVAGRCQNVAVSTEAHRVDGVVVAGELCDQIAVSEMPEEHDLVGAGRDEELAAVRELQNEDLRFVAGVVANALTVQHIPQPHRAIGRTGGHVVRVRMKL